MSGNHCNYYSFGVLLMAGKEKKGGEIMQTDLTVSPAKAFPDNFMDGLVMLYLEQQDLTGKTPEELVELYWETLYRIRNANREARQKAKEKWLT